MKELRTWVFTLQRFNIATFHLGLNLTKIYKVEGLNIVKAYCNDSHKSFT